MAFPSPFSFGHKTDFLSSLNGLLIGGQSLHIASGSVTARFEFRLKPGESPNGKDIENGEESSPENPFPDGERQLREGRRNDSVPINKP
jgi:hypothetical protein